MTQRSESRRRFANKCLIAAAWLVALLVAGPAWSQENNPYTTFHSMETFDRDGESVRALRIPVYITLRGWQDRDMGLRLRLAATAGVLLLVFAVVSALLERLPRRE